MKKYLIRSAKYLVAISVLYVALSWVMHYANNVQGITFGERMLAMLNNGWQGWSAIVGIILLAVTYPYFGYVKRHISGNIVTDRAQLNQAAEFTGLELVAESDGELVYRAKGLRRFVMLFEDEVRVRQRGEEVEIEGLRRIAVRMAFDAERYITNKRRVE